jgi:hypothetical protein
MKIRSAKAWKKAALKKTLLVRFFKRGERLSSFYWSIIRLDQEASGSVMVTE